MKVFSSLVRFLIVIYQRAISPYLGHHCRYYPTCSQYAFEAFEKFSFPRALWYSIKRLLKCNKFFPGGYDPLP